MKPLIVAEIGASHNGSLDRAIDTVRAAARAGADAIKLQTFTPDTMVADRSYVLKHGPWAGRNLYELYREAQTPWDWHEQLFRVAQAEGIGAFSTPFDETAVEFLETLSVPMYKVASFEITHHALIRKIAATGKPIIISTGMASLQEIIDAIVAAQGCKQITVLKCTSAYPAPLDQMNLAQIPAMASTLGVDVGLSDHTTGTMAAFLAAGMGATVIEKHITLQRAGGLDDEFAVEPWQFAQMVRMVADAVAMAGCARSLNIEPSESSQFVLRRGMYAVRDIEGGERITPDNTKARRPLYASSQIAANDASLVMGKRVTVAHHAGEALRWTNIND